MNVIGTRPDGWWKDRGRAMSHWWRSWTVGLRPGADLTVVFERPPSTAIAASGIEVTHAPRPAANSADDEIVRLSRPTPGRGKFVW